MTTGFNKVESAVAIVGIGGFFLAGTYGLFRIHWVLAVIAAVAGYYLLFRMHRIKICSFCDQKCPFHPRKRNSGYTKKGFSKTEMLIFYPGFLVLSIIYFIAIFRLNILAGILVTAVVGYISVIYRLKICPNCKLPCPVNPNKVR